MNVSVAWIALLGLSASLGCGDRVKALRGEHHDDESETKTAARSGEIEEPTKNGQTDASDAPNKTGEPGPPSEAAARGGGKPNTDRVVTRNPTMSQLLEVCEEMERRGESCLIAEGPDDVHDEALEAEQRRWMNKKLREVRDAERDPANEAEDLSGE
ncbi:MAG: hypothetical protein AAF219_09540 [Myxococcota bacterium]